MRILILGGTKYLGRAIVEAAQVGSHELTLFNRGETDPGLFPDIETIKGNRDGELDRLSGRRWDAVIDTCGYVPRIVGVSASALRDSVDRYVFVSTISVYGDVSRPGVDENAPVGKIDDESIEDIDEKTYGPLKALSEQQVVDTFGERALIVRPGLIVGPHDPTDRFTYWPHRMKKGGDFLAPGRPERLNQFIDVRDLAEWTVRLIENEVSGVFNATGPAKPVTMLDLLESCRITSGSDGTPVWVDETFLLDHEVAPWSDLPLWLPESNPEYGGFHQISIERAVANDLTFRQLDETIRATLEWAQSRPAEYEWKAGLQAERETALLQLWR